MRGASLSLGIAAAQLCSELSVLQQGITRYSCEKGTDTAPAFASFSDEESDVRRGKVPCQSPPSHERPHPRASQSWALHFPPLPRCLLAGEPDLCLTPRAGPPECLSGEALGQWPGYGTHRVSRCLDDLKPSWALPQVRASLVQRACISSRTY